MTIPPAPEKGNPPEDPAKGNPPADPEKGKADENIKELQRVISAKDIELKKAQDALKIYQEKTPESQKALDEMRMQIQKLSDEIKTANAEKRREVLEKAYPDIVPELLLGKTDAKVALIIKKQRAMNKKLFGDSHAFIKPEFENVGDIDKAIEAIKNDKTIRGELAALKVLDLERQRSKFLI